MKDLDLSIFPRVDKNHWTQLAENQLKGEDPGEALRWESAGISLNGYYDSSDISELQYLTDFFSAIEPHRWKLYEQIEVINETEANKNALKALMGGCDGVILNLNDTQSLGTILKDVDHNICDICFISESEIEVSGFTGFILAPNGNCVSGLDANPIDQICNLIKNQDKQKHIYRNAFPDFFLEISTVRALRYLLTTKNFKEVQIHTHVPMHASEEHQWFLNTTAGLASILGGSHSVDFSTAIGDPRISRNTGNLIREESGISEYSDQCGGSYYVEVLTDKIIKSVLEKLSK
ncbi:methylmalonyl-CoA mutase family protein [Ekhidna sp.]|uniref:methylmalonyl-CoA mutase family protein n=1 Tax=Ekhidna sp. TaxID=2608089 RepID=UPI0035169E34